MSFVLHLIRAPARQSFMKNVLKTQCKRWRSERKETTYEFLRELAFIDNGFCWFCTETSNSSGNTQKHEWIQIFLPFFTLSNVGSRSATKDDIMKSEQNNDGRKFVKKDEEKKSRANTRTTTTSRKIVSMWIMFSHGKMSF